MQKPTELRGVINSEYWSSASQPPLPHAAPSNPVCREPRRSQHNRRNLLSAQLVLTYHNVCLYKNRICIRSVHINASRPYVNGSVRGRGEEAVRMVHSSFRQWPERIRGTMDNEDGYGNIRRTVFNAQFGWRCAVVCK